MVFEGWLAGNNDPCLEIGDEFEMVEIARYGQILDGQSATLSGVDFPSADIDYLGRGGRSCINDNGQVAFKAYFGTDDNQTSAIYLFTPTLHWRYAGSGDWGEELKWTLGVNPQACHDVLIDPNSNVEISGPSDSATIKSVTIQGDGTHTATLRLNASGATTVLGDVRIKSGGTLYVTNGSLTVKA